MKIGRGTASILGYVTAFIAWEVLAVALALEGASLLNIGNWKAVGIATFVLIGLAFVMIKVGKKEDEDDEEKKRRGILKTGWKYWTTPILDSVRMSKNLYKSVLIRDKSPDGEVPFIFRRLRVEINVLISYLLRKQVYELKQQSVNVKSKIARQANRNLKTTWSACRQKGNAYQKRMGLRAVQNFDTSWSFPVRGFTRIKEDGVMHNDKCDTPGTMNSKNLIFRFFTILKEYLEDDRFLKGIANVSDLRSEFWRVKEVAGESFARLLGDISDHDGTFTVPFKQREGTSHERYEAFLGMIKNYGKTQIRDSCRIGIFDQTRKHGLYKHSYKFARPWARPFVVKGVIRNGEIVDVPGPPVEREVNPIGYVDNIDKWERDTGKLYEIDERGRILQDINEKEQEEEHNEGETVKYRKVRFNERVEHSALSHFLDTLVTEWDFFIQDLRKGQFHKNVRLVTEFLNCHNNPPFDWAYRKVYEDTSSRPDPGQEAPAFDREGLKDPCNFVYKGIKSLYHSEQNDIEQPYFVNNIPAVTTMGLTMYIQNLLDRIEGNMESKKTHASTYAWDDGKRTVHSFEIKEETKGDESGTS